MITVWGTGRGFRVVWLLEEMGLPYRLGLVTRQLQRAPYMAGGGFSAADISVTYALEFAQRTMNYPFGEAERAYIDRTTGREAYKRAMETCTGVKAWGESLAARTETVGDDRVGVR